MERCFFVKRNPVGITSVDVPFLESTETCIRGKFFFQFLVCFIYRLVIAYQPEIRLLTFLKDNFERMGFRIPSFSFSGLKSVKPIPVRLLLFYTDVKAITFYFNAKTCRYH